MSERVKQMEVKKVKGAAPTKAKCSGCFEECDADHGGIRCVGGCDVCLECAQSFVKATFDEMRFPLKCSCGNAVVVQSFERQLDAEQMNTYLQCMTQCDPSFLASDTEVVESCPKCKYWHLATKDAGRLLFYCKAEDCGVVSCLWCKKALTTARVTDRRMKRLGISSSSSSSSFVEAKESVTEDSFELHQKCAELSTFKAQWDEALRLGGGTQCPSCGLLIRKGYGCTHMRCTQCQTLFCYVCGLSEALCDKAPVAVTGTVSIMQHQIDWKKNAKRCPMWLSTLDKRYPAKEEECVDFFHALKTKALLQNCVSDFKKARVWTKMRRHFALDTSCGFALDDVVKGDHSLIVRSRKRSRAAMQ